MNSVDGMMGPIVSVVIVNFDSGSALTQTLASLETGMRGLEWDGVVVDNASTDGSEQAAHTADTRIKLLRQSRNRGFGAGVNIGRAATGAPFVLVLNPDCQLQPDAVRALLHEIERFPECAIVAPQILDPAGTLQESARGDPNSLTGLFGRTSFLSRMFPFLSVVRRNLAAEAVVKSGESSQPVDWVSGACMVVRRTALEQIGGFDERYFLYWEDADLCRRLRTAEWQIRYMPRAVAVHQVGQSSKNVPRLANREFHRSAYLYYTTHVISQRMHPARPVAWSILKLRALLKQFSPQRPGR